MNSQPPDWNLVDEWWALSGTRDTDTLADLQALLVAATARQHSGTLTTANKIDFDK